MTLNLFFGTTDTSLSFQNKKTLTSFDSGLLTRMIFIDLQKTFDSINQEIVLRKMTSLRFFSQSIIRIQSSLSNRDFGENIKTKLLQFTVEYHKDLS